LHQYNTSVSQNVWTTIFVPLAFLTPLAGIALSSWFIFPLKFWYAFILLYCLFAAHTPVWLLLRPRGILGGFVLYGAISIGLLGVFFGGHSIQAPAFKGFFTGGSTGQLFPFLFVTIACGACSGFHGLVCSGTTSKQIDKESHTHSIGYGAMCAEGLVAIISLCIIMMMPELSVKGLRPGTIYGRGLGEFLTMIIGRTHLAMATTFGAMAFSTFVFDTLDVSTRLGRYIVDELFQLKSEKTKWIGTLLTLLPPFFILIVGEGEGLWIKFWTLFGSANQLLAAMTLLLVSYWLYINHKNYWITLVPMVFVLVTTLYSLSILTFENFSTQEGSFFPILNSCVSLLLILLGLYLVLSTLLKIRRGKHT
jgi:carbon starvation protein